MDPFSYILVDLLVDLSLSGGGGNPENPPGYGLVSIRVVIDYEHMHSFHMIAN